MIDFGYVLHLDFLRCTCVEVVHVILNLTTVNLSNIKRLIMKSNKRD